MKKHNFNRACPIQIMKTLHTLREAYHTYVNFKLTFKCKAFSVSVIFMKKLFDFLKGHYIIDVLQVLENHVLEHRPVHNVMIYIY